MQRFETGFFHSWRVSCVPPGCVARAGASRSRRALSIAPWRTSGLRRDREQHVDMIGRQTPFFDLRSLWLSELAKRLALTPTQLQIQRLASQSRNEDTTIFAVPSRVTSALALVQRWSFIRVSGCSRWSSAGGPVKTSNCYCHPGAAGGTSAYAKSGRTVGGPSVAARRRGDGVVRGSQLVSPAGIATLRRPDWLNADDAATPQTVGVAVLDVADEAGILGFRAPARQRTAARLPPASLPASPRQTFTVEAR